MRIFHNVVLSILIRIMGRFRGKYLLKQWIDLETKKEQIIKAIQESDEFPETLCSYIHTATGIHWKWYEMGDWNIIIQLFYVCVSKSPQVELPITTPSDEKHKDESWDYPTRTWHLYSHLLAKEYGWDLEYIANLDVFEALAKIEEIIVDDQLEKEFYHGLSEIAYHYDKNSKTSKFVPLPRPAWMRTKVQPIKKFLIPKEMMPVGVVIMDGVLPEEFMPKEIH